MSVLWLLISLIGSFLVIGPGGVATWGKAVTDTVDAMGYKWERKGNSSKHIPFDWSGP